MKDKIIKFLKFTWILESNRPWHFIIVFFIGLLMSMDAVIAASATAEFKDWLWHGKKGGTFGWVYGNGFDWLDFLASMFGGILGHVVKLMLLS